MAKGFGKDRPSIDGRDDRRDDDLDFDRTDYLRSTAYAALPSATETTAALQPTVDRLAPTSDETAAAFSSGARTVWNVMGPAQMDAGTSATFQIVRKGAAIPDGEEQSISLDGSVKGDAVLPSTILDQIHDQLVQPGAPEGIWIERNRLYFSSDAPSKFTFTITVDDAPDQTGDGRFILALSNPSDGDVATKSVSVDVVGADAPPLPEPSDIAVADAVAVDEGDGTGDPNVLRFFVDRTGDGDFADTEVSFDFETFLRASPSQIALATPGTDYVATSGTVTFGAGVTRVAVDVSIIGDLTPETDELVDFRILNAQGPDGTEIVTRLATGVILNDDEAPFPPSTFSILDADTVVEGETGDLVYRVVRDGEGDYADTTASVHFNTFKDIIGALPQATPGVDYAPTSGTLSFAAGETEKFITVDVLDDSQAEVNEQVLIRLTNPVGQPGTGIADGQAEGIIVDDDTVGPSFITLSDAVATPEGDPGDTSGLVFEITRTGVGAALDVPVSVNYTTWYDASVDGTPADPNKDFTPTFGVFTFAANQTVGFLTVGLVEDTTEEDNEIVTLRISNPVGPAGTEILQSEAHGLILDDDAPTFAPSRFSISDPSAVMEGDPGAEGEMAFVVSRTGSGNYANAEATVHFRTIDSTPSGGLRSATAGEDYAPTSGLIHFAAGETEKLVTVQLTADLNVENDELLTVELHGPSGPPGTFITDSRGTGEIIDDDLDQVSASHFSIADAEWVLEYDPGQGFRTLEFDITREGTGNFADAQAVLQIETAGRVIPFLYPPATEGVDFADYDGAFTFAAGVTQRTFQVAIFGDTLEEANEGVSVKLLSVSGAAGSTIVDNEGIGVIVDDDTPITSPSLFTIMDAPSVTEGDDGGAPRMMTFEVTRTGAGSAIAAEATVQFNTFEHFPPVPNGASSGSDYVSTATTLTFAPGQTLKTVSVEIVGDNISEANETVFAELRNPEGPAGGLVTGDGTAQGTIVDNEPAAAGSVFHVADAFSAEGDPGETGHAMVFEVTRTGMGDFADGTASVHFSTFFNTIGGIDQARPNEDYTPTSGTLLFEAGETSRFVSVAIIPDTTTEANETITLLVNNPQGPAGTVVADGEAIGIIYDDDQASYAASRFSISDPLPVTEGDPDTAGEMVFVVSRSGIGNFLNAEAAVSFRTIDSATSGGQHATTAGEDYVSTSGLVHFAAGETEKLVTVQLVADLQTEPDELLTVELHNPTGPAGTYITDRVGVGRVLDDDLDQTDASHFSVMDADWVLENDPGQGYRLMEFDIVREGTGNFADAQAVLQIETAGRVIPFLYPPATEGVDFVDYDGTFTFGAGVTQKTFYVPIYGDDLAEQNEGIAVRLLGVDGAPGSTIVDGEGIGVIVDDDTAITNPSVFFISDAAPVTEGGPDGEPRVMTFEITRDGSGSAIAAEASVQFFTSEPFPPVPHTATAGVDYVYTATVVHFAPAQTSQVVSVQIIGDTVAEGNEIVYGQLINPQGPAGGAIGGDGIAQGTITDDDGSGPAPLALADVLDTSDGDLLGAVGSAGGGAGDAADAALAAGPTTLSILGDISAQTPADGF